MNGLDKYFSDYSDEAEHAVKLDLDYQLPHHIDISAGAQFKQVIFNHKKWADTRPAPANIHLNRGHWTSYSYLSTVTPSFMTFNVKNLPSRDR